MSASGGRRPRLPAWAGHSLALAFALAGAAAFVGMGWQKAISPGGGWSPLACLRMVPAPVEYVRFDHLTYLAIAENVSQGQGPYVEPFTGTSTSIYPPGYYWMVGTLDHLTSLTLVESWNVLGILTAIGLVAMAGAWARWAAPGTYAYALAALPLMVGTLAWWQNDSWLQIYRDGVALWAPYVLLDSGTGESAAMLVAGVALLTLCATLISEGRRQLVLAGVTGVLLGSMVNLHAYVATFMVVVSVAVVAGHELLVRPSRNRALAGLAGLVVVLALFASGLVDLQPTTKIGVVVAVLALVVLTRRSWLERYWRPAVVLVAPMIVLALPMVVRILASALDPDSFFYTRQDQSVERALSFPGWSMLAWELPVWALAIAALVGIWRGGLVDPRRRVWLVALAALTVVTPLLVLNEFWGVDQEPYRFLPYGMMLVAVVAFPWLWQAITRGDIAARTSAIFVGVLLALTIPTTVEYGKAVDRIPSVCVPDEERQVYHRIVDITGDDIVLLDTCFWPALTNVSDGPNVVEYHAGLAHPDRREGIDRLEGLLAVGSVPTVEDMQAAGVRWFLTHSACEGLDDQVIAERFGQPTVTVSVDDPAALNLPPGAEYQLYEIAPEPSADS